MRVTTDEVMIYTRVNLLDFYPDIITEERDFLVELPFGAENELKYLNPITETTYDEFESFLMRR